MFHWKKTIAVLSACVLVTACAGAFAEDYTASAPGMGGDVPVNELEGLLGEDIFENADCDTIGGFITETLGRIPQAGETLPLDDRDDAELAVALESHLESRELMAQIMALPPPDGELFLRRYLYGETAAQLGVRFAMPAATVRTRLHRARLALQKLLKED